MRVIESAIILAAIGSAYCYESIPSSHRLYPRQDFYYDSVCPLGKGYTTGGDAMDHFSAIGTRYLYFGVQKIPGPIAARDAFTDYRLDGITINEDTPADCHLDKTDIYSYGLVANIIGSEGKVTVFGNAYGRDINISEVITKGDECNLEHEKDPIDWDEINVTLSYANRYLQDIPPDLKIDDTGTIIRTTNEPRHPHYHVITLNTCTQPGATTCSQYPLDVLSDPSGIIYDGSEWAGPNDPENFLLDGRTIVVNIPVPAGETLTTTTDNISAKFPTCRTIFNIYSLDVEDYYSYDDFSANINGNGLFEGLILAPHATMEVKRAQTIGGKVFARDFTVYPSAQFNDFTCGSYDGCMVLYGFVPPVSSSTSSCGTETTTETKVSTATTTVGTLTTTDTSTTVTTHKTTVETLTSTFQPTDPTTMVTTVASTFTTTDTSGPTTTTRVYTSMATVIVPVQNEWPPYDYRG
ncbi:hypothetical protein BJV82DRAFT_586890 [Fennellomyces sp. T-0311]|nr:hypothetical protein BJV82DRAFT_586890 [Fennellomyces sp. T-0311]